ncbi:MAG: hypothetical protein E7614_06865 [Ruminococcaceae bacterium]|nr:hypothetical protein [Oscillospiraceae bacterium]
MVIFKSNECNTPPRADMFLPDFLKHFGFFLVFLAVIFLVATFITQIWGLIIGVLICGMLGITAWLCWKNQTIKIIDEDQFEYTTFLGKTTLYRFSDIRDLRANKDSLTLILTNGKVHIESMVCMSETLYNKIEASLSQK